MVVDPAFSFSVFDDAFVACETLFNVSGVR